MLWFYNQCQYWEMYLNVLLTINSKCEVASFLSHRLVKLQVVWADLSMAQGSV